MKPFVLALRAIGAAFVMRLYFPLVIGAVSIIVILVSGALWLTTVDEWWWLLFIPITSLLIVLFAVGFVILMVVRLVRPAQTKAQQQAVKQFIDKLQGVAEIVGTPKVIIFFRVVRSIAAPSKDSFLTDLVKNGELGKEFRAIQASFSK